jgi:hypothetical protein
VTDYADRVDLARHHAFEVSAWRDRNLDPEARSWGWTVRMGGAVAAQSEDRDRHGTSGEAFAAGERRLLAILKSRATSAAADLRLIATTATPSSAAAFLSAFAALDASASPLAAVSGTKQPSSGGGGDLAHEG